MECLQLEQVTLRHPTTSPRSISITCSNGKIRASVSLVQMMVHRALGWFIRHLQYKGVGAKNCQAALAQLGERQTEDLKAPCSIHGGGIVFEFHGILGKNRLQASFK